VNKKLWNWRLWVGFALAVVALMVNGAFFVAIRGIVWLSMALFIVSAVLLSSGLRRAFGQQESYRGQVAGPILTGLSVVVLALFGFITYEIPKHFAVANGAPRVGQAAPQFALVDTTKKRVSLTEVLASGDGAAKAPKAVLLVFYRGYW
jgi:hypothetical protein